ncbi:hypothetical protein PR202_ga28363 [Eleusine coracana subsp. coracana]|uniref:F-box domain-containing protein n=1 Tax=Eleusine coracana subsp. coracana TaxID=191504 RepID=A0AAV5DJ16_ELECO|nr:hypothetical protein PR202_ga28363 [Eleusine coracana subsp. coracana]
MAQGGGGIAAERANPSGEDRISVLPDDALVLILLHLDTAAAVRTSVLSRRWRRVWTLLPELRFDFSPEPHPVASALAVHEAALRFLDVGALDAAPESVAAWLPVAANRLSGRLNFENRAPPGRNGDGEEDGERGAFELPCFKSATTVSLDLGFLRLAVPAAGVFAQLTELRLVRVRICGPCKLGDAVSSPRCPCLQRLTVHQTQGLDNITIRSESLLRVDLNAVSGLQQFNVVAPALKELTVRHCFFRSRTQPIADISAPQMGVARVDRRGFSSKS